MQSVYVLADEVTETKSKSAGRFQQGNKKPKPPRNPLPGAQRQSSADPAAETRTCLGCLVKCHILRDCPDNPLCPPTGSKVMIAMGEDETTDKWC